MRKALNDNPLVQVAAIALLGIVVAFLLLTRLQGSDPEPPPADTTATATDATAAPSATAPAPVPAPTAPAPGTTPPADTADVAVGEFVAGPGLPAKLVDAYDRGATVVLLITRSGGIDDAKVRNFAQRLQSEGDVALFSDYTRNIARYSRIAQGVDVNRVPVVIALAPKNVTDGAPVATVSYGFRGYDSLRQVVRDAAYDGERLPYHPE